MKDLTPYQRQAYELRQKGHTIQEIAQIMGKTREPVRQWIAAARRKLGLKSEAFDDDPMNRIP
jgi:DNA-binding CsgD family transcriptional regulator